MDKTFPRDFEALKDISAFVLVFLDAEGLNASFAFTMDLVIEELFTNMVKYSPEGAYDIQVGLECDGERITIRLTDRDVEAFDVTQAPRVDTERGLDERKPGGLGLHFVRTVADSFTYHYEDRTSVITVTRRLENWDV